MYVLNNDFDTVLIYSRDGTTGLLTSLGTAATGDEPYYMEISPDDKNIYERYPQFIQIHGVVPVTVGAL